ncbi:TadA family conjugal transfer-associated ATPase [Arthrobacter sp. Br18]|uniref:TadA family conjugal transfer-associated ATPase n=1 Tax=Arthrobacter sp. Br18 TaxID=1312954 RepID=UPI0004B357E1|nr:TadA family conjugal transfer-associated ATPase [Arthrobacter sp. Br18]
MVSEVRTSVLAGTAAVTAAGLADAVRTSGRLLGSEGTLNAVDRIRAELQGLGPLQHLLGDENITDILVNGPTDTWVDGAGGLRRVPRLFERESEVRALAVRLIAAGGRRLDDGSPCVDVRLGGYRIHAVLPPLSTGGTLLSIRIRRAKVFSLADLVASGTVQPDMEVILRAIIRGRLNFLISGATGTGKTTLLSALLGMAGSGERLVLVEDAAELNPQHPHTVGLQSRHGNLEGAGAVDLAELVRHALRMRPDRLIVGECRGGEVRELLMAMNTGHDGAGGTVHANSATAVPARLTALGALAGLSPASLALQAGTALDVVIHLLRVPAGRRTDQIALVDLDRGQLRVRPALSCNDNGCVKGEAWDALQQRLTDAGHPI